MDRATSLRKCSFLAIVSLALPAQAAFITFDPDGAAPGNSPQTIGGLDWSVGNSVAKSLIPFEAGTTFQLHYQSNLAGVINTSGQTVAPVGLNSAFELTAVSSVTAVVTSFSATGFTYQLAAVQSPNSFCEIWYDSTPDADNLAGTGFNDGTRILLGGPNQAVANVGNYSSAASIAVFDQFGNNDYPGVTSQTGAGGFTDENGVSTTDPTFFISQVITSMSFNTSMVTPFKEQNPSHLFAGLPGGAPPAVVPNIGTVNGVSGPDFQFQSDGNVTFTFVPIPEPAAAIGTIAMGALGLLSRRRRS